MLVQRPMLVLMMTHGAMRTIVLLMLFMHLHVAESLVALRPIHHVVVPLICIVEHVAPVRRYRIQGRSGGRRMIGEGSSGVSGGVCSRGVSRAMGLVQQIRGGLLIPQRTIGHQLGKALARERVFLDREAWSRT